MRAAYHRKEPGDPVPALINHVSADSTLEGAFVWPCYVLEQGSFAGDD